MDPMIEPQYWALMHLLLILLVTCVQMVIVYALGGAGYPIPGLGLYTVYFMAALLGWLAYTVRQMANIPMPVDVPSVAAIINSFILFCAAGQRAQRTKGRLTLGVVCIAACFAVFFVPPSQTFALQAGMAALCFACVAWLSLFRARRRDNLGDAITGFAAISMVLGTGYALYLWFIEGNAAQAIMVGTAFHTAAYVVVLIAFLASVLIEYQQHLSHVATEDPLTRLLNRRGLEGALHVTFAQSAREQLHTAAVLLDIDGLKEINENFGPDTGDQVVRQVAQLLRRLSRSSDVLARIGGDEYLMILPATSLDDARSLADRLRDALTSEPLAVSQQRIALTASLGVAGVMGQVDLDHLIAQASRAVGLAKQGGSNRVASVESKPIHLSTTATKA